MRRVLLFAEKLETRLLLVDLLIGLSAWYLFMCLLDTVYSHSKGILTVSILFSLRLISSSLLLFASGIIADRVGVSRTLRYDLYLLIFLTAILYVLCYGNYGRLNLSDNLILCSLLLIAAFVEALLTIYNSLKYTLPVYVSDMSLEKLNAIFELSYSILLIVGPLIAVGLIHLTLLGVVIVIVCQIIAVKLLSFMKPRLKLNEQNTVQSINIQQKPSLIYDVLHLSNSIKIPQVLRALICSLFISFAGGVVNIALVLLASYISIFAPLVFIDIYSFIIACIGLGSAIASFTIMRSCSPRIYINKFFLTATLLIAIYPLTIVLALAFKRFSLTLFVLLLLFSIFNGWGNSIVFIKLVSLIQRYAPRDSIAKVVTLTSLLNNVVTIVSTIITGIISGYITILYILLFVASLMLVTPLILNFEQIQQLRSL